MTLLLNQVVQAQCPGCKNTLKIPANWISEPMKCKHCGLVFQAKPPKQKKHLIQRAFRAATSMNMKLPKLRKRKKKDKGVVAQSKPHAPPPGVVVGIPTAGPALPGAQAAVPVAKVAGQMGIATAPVAMAIGGAAKSAVPVAAPVPMGLVNGQKPPSFRRRSRGSWQKLAFIMIFLLGLGSLAAVVHHMNPDLFDINPEVADAGDKDPAVIVVETGKTTTKATSSFVPKVTTAAATKPLFTSVIVTRATLPKRTFPVIETRPNPTGPAVTRPEDTRPQPTKPVIVEPPPIVDKGKGYPRRMFAISVNKYESVTPVSYGGAKDRTKAFNSVVFNLAEIMFIPAAQVVMLSESDPGNPVPPTKSLLMNYITQYLESSRPMDRVVLMFVGHCVEKDGASYLMPLDGDPEKEKSLIPLDWVFKKLAACPAQEKLLILDVCRFDKQRGEELGKVERMTEGFEAALQKPPKGVQVLSACSAGQYSWEVETNTNPNFDVDGGVFLSAIAQIKKEGGLRAAKDQKPEEPLPVPQLHSALLLRVQPKVKSYLKNKDGTEELQTPKLYGMSPEKVVAYDPKGTTPTKLKPKVDESEYPGGIATAVELEPILRLPNQIPPIRQGDTNSRFVAQALRPYAKKPLLAYKDDKEDSDFRAFIKEGVDLLIKHNGAFQDTFPPLPPNPQQKNQYVAQIGQQQMNLALVYAELERKYEELKELAPQRATEKNKNWQANYDYVMARIQFRMAYFYEYNAMLGKIRKEELPPLDMQIHKGYKLAAKATMADRDAQKIADNAKKILKNLANDNKDTPWEMIGKRGMATSLGLEWTAY